MDFKEMNMESSITILKEFVNKYFSRDLEKNYILTIELDEFINSYEINIEDKTKKEKIRFFINREVENFRYIYYESSDSKLPHMSMDEAKVTADKFLERFLGDRYKKLKLNEDIVLVGCELNQYTFWYKEYEDDIEINKSYVMIYVDGNIDKVVYFDNHLEKYFKIEDEKKIISEDKALKIFKDNINFKLNKSVDDTLIYEPSTAIEGHFIYAKEGKYINEYAYMESEEELAVDESINIMDKDFARKIFFNNIQLGFKYIIQEDTLKLVYCIKPKSHQYYGIAINALDGSLNNQYTKWEDEILDVSLRKYERELNIFINRNIIDTDFDLDSNARIGDVIRLITKVLESRIEFLEEKDDEEILFIDINWDNPYYEYVKKAIDENLIQNKEQALNVFREATIEDIKDLLLYAVDPYGDEADYDDYYEESKYKKIILDVLSRYDNKKITNEELVYIFYMIFSK